MKYKLHVVEYPKAAPKIVLLHGLGGTHRYWLTGLDRLRQHYHLVLVDLLGFGDSDKPWINYTKEAHLQALEDVLQRYDYFIIIGHSLGAALSMAYSARNPTQVVGQVLISLPFFPTKQRAYQWMRRAPSGWLQTNMLTTIVACLVTRHIMGRFLPRLLPNFPVEVTEDVLKHTFLSSTTTLWQILYRSTIAGDADQLSSRVKTLCIHSIDDDTAPYDALVSLINQHHDWDLKKVDNGAHHPWLWNNSICLEVILETLPQWLADFDVGNHQADRIIEPPR